MLVEKKKQKRKMLRCARKVRGKALEVICPKLSNQMKGNTKTNCVFKAKLKREKLKGKAGEK